MGTSNMASLPQVSFTDFTQVSYTGGESKVQDRTNA